MPGTYGIREPDPARCAPWTGPIDAVIVPGVAFDGRGGRMGYGAGYYDRFLTGPADGAVRVAVAFSCQVVDALPLEPHDAPMHWLVTEDGAFRLPASTFAVQSRAARSGNAPSKNRHQTGKILLGFRRWRWCTMGVENGELSVAEGGDL